MYNNSLGNMLRVKNWGERKGMEIGWVVDGWKKGIKLKEEEIK